MKRIIAAIAGLVVVGGAAAPYVSGHLLENAFDQAEPATLPVDGLYWYPVSFERGYLGSQARSELIFRQPGHDDVVIELEHDIQQRIGLDGRYAQVQTRLDLDNEPQTRQLIEQWLEGEPVPTINTRLYPSGNSLSALDLPPIERPLSSFSGASLAFSTQRNGFFGYEFTMPELHFKEHAAHATDGEAILERLHLAGEGRVNEDGFIWDSRTQLTADRMRFSGGGNDALEINQLSLQAQSDRDENLLDLGFDLRFGALQMPHDTLTNGHYHLKIARLDATAVAVMAERFNALSQRAHPGTEALAAQYQRVLLDEVPRLFSQGPKVQLSPFMAESEFGPSRVDLTVQLAPNAMPSDLGPMAILALIGSLSVEGSLQVPLAMLEAQYQQTDPNGSVEQELAFLVAEGWVDIEEDMVKSRINYQQGQLELNGQRADALMNMLLGL